MKRIYLILLSVVLMTLSSVDMSAQRTPKTGMLNNSGIRIECNAPIDVFIDGVKMCNAVNSCMVANLPRGRYWVEAFVVNSNQGYGVSRLVFNESVTLNSMEVKNIVVRSDGTIGGSYGNADIIYPPIMDDATYAQLLEQIEETSFNSDKKQIIEMAKTHNLFTTEQVKAIARTMNFDRDKMWVLKTLYPYIIDRDRAFTLQEVLSHSSSKKEFSKYVTDYDRQQTHTN